MSLEVRVEKGGLDESLRKYRAPGTRFILGHGTFETRGAWGFTDLDCTMLAPGCSLEGQGHGATVVKLFDPIDKVGGTEAAYFETLTAGSRSRLASGGSVSGLTVDASMASKPVVGLHAWASCFRVSDVMVVGVWGSRSRPYPNEGFGALVNPCLWPSAIAGGNVVERVRVVLAETASGSDAENYSTGIYCGIDAPWMKDGTPLLRSFVRNCEVAGNKAHCGFGINRSTTIQNSECSGVVRAIYTDTGSVSRSEVRGLRAYGIEWGVELRTVNGATVSGLLLVNNSFEFNPSAAWSQAILLDTLTDPGNPGGRISLVRRCGNSWLSECAKRSKGRARGDVEVCKYGNDAWGIDPWSTGDDWEDVILQAGAKFRNRP